MVIHEIGIQSALLKLIKAKKKTVEVRLNKGKFQLFIPGDRLRFREDFWEKGEIVRSVHTTVMVHITAIDQFGSVESLLDAVSFKKIAPAVSTRSGCKRKLASLYSVKDQKRLGLLAVHFKLDK